MAKNKGNQVMKNVRGMFGKQVVFKIRLGTEYVSAPPNVNENRIPKPAEGANRRSFAEAVAFGKYVVTDPELKAKYAALVKQGQTAYNAAVSDARLPPKIKSLITQGYTGQTGSCILIQATDNVKVNKVSVSIYNEALQLIEEGEASDNGDNMNWIYRATVPVANITGYTVEVSASDIAENVTTRSAVI